MTKGTDIFNISAHLQTGEAHLIVSACSGIDLVRKDGVRYGYLSLHDEDY